MKTDERLGETWALASGGLTDNWHETGGELIDWTDRLDNGR